MMMVKMKLEDLQKKFGGESWLHPIFCFCLSLLFSGQFSPLNYWLSAVMELCGIDYLCKVILYLLPLFCTYAMHTSTGAFFFFLVYNG